MLDLTIRDFDGEPRMRDLDIAEALEFEDPYQIRRLIERNRTDLESFGVFVTMTNTPEGGGRPATEHWLNEEQALFLCTRSEARGAVLITKQMVMVFAAWRRGQLPEPDAPGGAPVELPPDASIWRDLIREARLLFGRDRARWLWHQSALPQPPDFIEEMNKPVTEPQAVALQFLRVRTDVTGNRRDFVTARELLDSFEEWALPLGHVLGSRTVSNALKAVLKGYRDPATGRGVTPHKRNVKGYLGLCLRPPE